MIKSLDLATVPTAPRLRSWSIPEHFRLGCILLSTWRGGVKNMGLLRHFVPRNDEEGEGLAMTKKGEASP